MGFSLSCSGGGQGQGGQDADQLGGQAGGQRGRAGGWLRPGRGCGRAVGGKAGHGAPPGGDALAGQYAQAERERLAARVQGSMTQLFVAGIQPAAGGTVLAGFQAGAWVSSRVAR
jgi:hypothetical protein